MKRSFIFVLSLFAFLLLFPVNAKADYIGELVEINEINFPDAAFRDYIKAKLPEQIEKHPDETYWYMVPSSPIAFSVQNTSVSSIAGVELMNVSDLTVEGCTNLSRLNLNDQTIHVLTVSNCSSLQELSVENCWSLRRLSVSQNSSLALLNAENCSFLTAMECSGNPLTRVSAAGCTALPKLVFNGNQTEELDLTGCVSLTNLNCQNNKLSVLKLAGCDSLQSLICSSNELNNLTLQNLPALKNLQCSKNDMVSLSLTGCPNVINIFCADNQLTELNVRSCTSLNILECYNNALSSVDLSGLDQLNKLILYSNRLNELDISPCPVLCDYVKGKRNAVPKTNGSRVYYRITSSTGDTKSYLTYDASVKLIYDEGVLQPGELPGTNEQENNESPNGTDHPDNPGSPDENKDLNEYVTPGSNRVIDNLKYTVTESSADGTRSVTLTSPLKKNLKKAVIPASVKIGNASYKVTAIAANAFKGNKKLTKVTIGANIKTIGASAFAGDKKLKTITIKSKTLKKIGKKAFKGIHKNARFKVPAKKRKLYRKLIEKAGTRKTVTIK